jgi:hypothetical protein
MTLQEAEMYSQSSTQWTDTHEQLGYIGTDMLITTRTEEPPAQTDDERAFGTHIREAATTVRKLFSR